MKLLCIFSFTFLFALSVGFNYSYNVPKEAFSKFDWLIINPNVKYEKKAKLIAYISVGERIKAKKSWIIGKNKSWKSYIVDIRNKDYQNFLLNELKKYKNFDGFFFDTLDSFYMTKVDKKSYVKELGEFLKRVRELYPKKIIIFNRGFELLDYVKPDALVVENLFWVNGKRIPKNSKKWLFDKLNRAKKMGIKVIVIEYVEPFNRIKARFIAKKIKRYGFIPYVADKYLKVVGVGE